MEDDNDEEPVGELKVLRSHTASPSCLQLFHLKANCSSQQEFYSSYSTASYQQLRCFIEYIVLFIHLQLRLMLWTVHEQVLIYVKAAINNRFLGSFLIRQNKTRSLMCCCC